MLIESVSDKIKQHLQSELGLEVIAVLRRAPIYPSDCPLPEFDSRLTNTVTLMKRDRSNAVRLVVAPGNVNMDVGMRRGNLLSWWYEHGLYQAGRFPGSEECTNLLEPFSALPQGERLRTAQEIIDWALNEQKVELCVHDFRPEAGAGEPDLTKFFPR